MPLVQIADVVVPEVYTSYQAVDNPERTAFIESGVAVRSVLLDSALDNGGRTVHIPFWNDIDPAQEPNYSNDNPAQLATPQKIVAGDQLARIAMINFGLQAADLAGELAGSDPMRRIRNRFGTYWMRQFQRRIIATAHGLYNDNVAANAGDMVRNIAAESVAATTALTRFNRENFTSAVFTLGDMFEEIQAIAVHSLIFKTMIDNEDIVYLQDSKGTFNVPTYLGKRVIIDDSLPIIPGTTDGFTYLSVLFGRGAIGWGEREPHVPVEIDRVAEAGNGGGIETLWERKSWIVHPAGYKFESAVISGGTGQSATLADLRLATNWTRIIPRKNVPIAFLRTN